MAFQKGQSGNPGGRPKENDEVKLLAREYTPEAIDRLAFWMRGDNPKASVSASATLLDRGWGRPAQAFTDADGGPVSIIVQRFTENDGQS